MKLSLLGLARLLLVFCLLADMAPATGGPAVVQFLGATRFAAQAIVPALLFPRHALAARPPQSWSGLYYASGLAVGVLLLPKVSLFSLGPWLRWLPASIFRPRGARPWIGWGSGTRKGVKIIIPSASGWRGCPREARAHC